MKNNSAIKKKTSNILVNAFRLFFLISVGYIIIFQLIYIVTYAFRPSEQINDPSVVWLSDSLTLQHLKDAFGIMEYQKSFLFTCAIQVASGLLEVFTCAIAAYGFSRFDFFGKNIFFVMVMLTIIIPTQMLGVPMYLNYARFDVYGIFELFEKLTGIYVKPNLLDTGWVFYLPAIFGAGYRSGLFIFIYRQFFKGLPKELEEAAAIDGAGPFSTFLRIVIPSSSVVILTVSIFSVVWHWNEYYNSVLFFDEKFPLSVRLSMLTVGIGGKVVNDRGFTMAGCLIFMLPVLIMYAFLQNKFVKSIDRVGIVG